MEGRVATPAVYQKSGRGLLNASAIVFGIFAGVNFLAACSAPIADCDEVFNYWEPTHYLNHGYGLQTWEYSPEFSIRSWLYVALHAVFGKVGSLISTRKTFQFYLIRFVLAVTCAICETRLFSALSRNLNPRVGILFVIIMISSPGPFYASVAYLPSSFSMYTSLLGVASFFDRHRGNKTAEGIMWFGIGGIIGWPFSMALMGPLLVNELGLAFAARDVVGSAGRVVDGIWRSLLILVLQLCVELFFYRKLVLVPWNIVSYNIFSGPGRGPEIFGTESWNFYIRNLLLNFSIWFLFALLAMPAVLFQHTSSAKGKITRSLAEGALFITPFYMWLFIFSMQPHKEERFMYPAYPFLAINAAISIHIILVYLGSSEKGKTSSRFTATVMTVATLVALSAMAAGVLRIAGTLTAYGAPLRIYNALQRPGLAEPGANVCFGKEWHRFPSSYFLPNGLRPKFIKSAFDGLLPGEFQEGESGLDLFRGTWSIPPGMNDQNLADPSKYSDITSCEFLVDLHITGSKASILEPEYILESENWKELQCYPFLDTARTSTLSRVLWIPDVAWVPQRFRRRWGRYCILQRQHRFVK